MITNVLIGLVIALCILTLLALIMSIAAIVIVLALKNSTHRVEWRDVDVDDVSGFMNVEQMNKKIKEEQDRIDDDLT